MKAIVVGAVLGCVYYTGWVVAHSEVAHECRVLGAFYVGAKVFDCKER